MPAGRVVLWRAAQSPAARCGAGEARRGDMVAVLALLAQPSLSAVPVPPLPQAAREAAFPPSPSASYQKGLVASVCANTRWRRVLIAACRVRAAVWTDRQNLGQKDDA